MKPTKKSIKKLPKKNRLEIYHSHIRGLVRKHKIKYAQAKFIWKHWDIVEKIRKGRKIAKERKDVYIDTEVKKLHPIGLDLQKISKQYFTNQVRYPLAYKQTKKEKYGRKKRYKILKHKVYDYKYGKWISKAMFGARVRARKKHNHIKEIQGYYNLSYAQARLVLKYINLFFGIGGS